MARESSLDSSNVHPKFGVKLTTFVPEKNTLDLSESLDGVSDKDKESPREGEKPF